MYTYYKYAPQKRRWFRAYLELKDVPTGDDHCKNVSYVYITGKLVAEGKVEIRPNYSYFSDNLCILGFNLSESVSGIFKSSLLIGLGLIAKK